jgi:HSP20 family protein
MNEIETSRGAASEMARNGASKVPLWRVTPELDLYESDGEYLLQLDVPGASPEGLNIQLLGTSLQIRAERAPAAQGGDVALVSFERTVELPAEVDAESARAQLKNGILEIRISKSSAARRVRIPINSN